MKINKFTMFSYYDFETYHQLNQICGSNQILKIMDIIKEKGVIVDEKEYNNYVTQLVVQRI